MELFREIESSIFNTDDAAAVELSPAFHARLVLELITVPDDPLTIYGLPFIFVTGSKDHFRVLNSQQYRVRKKYNVLLKSYADKYKNYINFINAGYKINEGQQTCDAVVLELRNFVKRLSEYEKQIDCFGQV